MTNATDSYTDRISKANTAVENMRIQVEEIATHLGGTVDHRIDQEAFSSWLSSNIYLPSGMSIYFHNNTRSLDKPVFQIGFNWSISAKNGAIWDRMSHLTKSSSVSIYCSYRAFAGISAINVSALKRSDRIAKEIKSRMLNAGADEAFKIQLENWISNETQIYNDHNSLKKIASSCKSQYPIDLERIGSDSFSFSSETYKHTKIRSTHGGQFNLELHFLSEDELMQILRITNRLK